jgi:mRNA interferase MazF
MRKRALGVPKRGEVWQVDLGVTQKVRPALIISIPYEDTDRALIGIIPHTTATRGSQFEVSVPARFLSEGVFLVQGIQAIPPKYFLRRLGLLPPEQLRRVENALLHWQGFRQQD